MYYGAAFVLYNYIKNCLYIIHNVNSSFRAPIQDMRMQTSSSYNLLQNSRAAGDVESGNMQKPGDPMKAGVI